MRLILVLSALLPLCLCLSFSFQDLLQRSWLPSLSEGEYKRGAGRGADGESDLVERANANGQCGAAYGPCGAGLCCSIEGYCGKTPDYCNAPDCQTAYGPGCDANKVPSGVNTSSIARTKFGSVLWGGTGVYHCVTNGDVALTFDDGPYIYTSHILDLLDQYKAKATFFIVGINNGKGEIDNFTLPWAGLVQRMYNSNHHIGSHTWSHADLCTLDSVGRKNEMWKNEMAIQNIIGVIPTYMRPPYSSCTAACGCQADMRELGYHISYFDLDTQDYLNDDPVAIKTSRSIFDDALASSIAADDNFLAISHDIHSNTANYLVEAMLQSLQTRGYKAVTLGECLGDPKANWYRAGKS